MALSDLVSEKTSALEIADESGLRPLVIDMAVALERGDVVALSGDLGAGKTTFARALIRYLTEDAELEVPSPTFTFVQAYETKRFPVIHADLYRVKGSDELDELGFDDLPEGAVLLVEWAERAPEVLPPDYWELAFEVTPERG